MTTMAATRSRSGRLTQAMMSARMAVRMKATAAISSCRVVRSEISPPSRMPPAEHRRKAVKAALAVATGMSCRVTSAETEKAWMPVDVNDRVPKKRKNSMIGFENRSLKPPGCAPSGATASFFFFGTASSCRLFHCVASAAMTRSPKIPTATSAARQPRREASRIMVAGAAAEPRWPAKV
jgi:hypothetical protein